MGNSLLQYAYARILSKELDQYLPPYPIVGFPKTYEEVNLNKKNTGGGECLVLTKINLWDQSKIKDLMKTRENIFIKSSCCHYNNFKNYKTEIRKDWFNIAQPYDRNKLNINKFFIRKNGFEPIKIERIENDDIVISVRLGEIVSGKHLGRLLTFDYFDIILKNIKFNRLYITSESIDSPLLIPFDKYSPIYFFQSNYMETLNLIRLFNRVVISQSSYSWWAAYLSEAEEIYYPIVVNGPWVIDPQNDVDLRVDEDRYIYVSQSKSKILGRFKDIKEWK